MKFNKSAESDFWYVGFDDDAHVGKIIRNDRGIYIFRCEKDSDLSNCDINEIFLFICDANFGIDTTSTFKSNSELI